MNWIKKANGHYTSQDGRFTIIRDDLCPAGRANWIITDLMTIDPVTPQYLKSKRKHTLESAKNTATRWSKQ